MKTRHIRFAIGLIVLLFACVASAKSSAKSDIIISDKPPAGFEFSEQPQTTLIDVYYAGLYVKSFYATFTATSVHFERPAVLVNLLPGLRTKTLS